MLLLTTDVIPGHRITAVHGLVRGNCVRAKHVGRDIGAGLKSLVGGELSGYSELMEESRKEAIVRMIAEADKKGADAILGIRITSANIMSGTAEILVYGTAVSMVAE